MKTDKKARVTAIREDAKKLEAAGHRVRLVEDKRSIWLEVRRVTNLGTEFVFSVRFPGAYPWVAPTARLLEPVPYGKAPHQYGDGTLCLSIAWNRKERNLAAYIAALDAYALLFERHQLTGENWGSER